MRFLPMRRPAAVLLLSALDMLPQGLPAVLQSNRVLLLLVLPVASMLLLRAVPVQGTRPWLLANLRTSLARVVP